jgi:hypothetical protein
MNYNLRVRLACRSPISSSLKRLAGRTTHQLQYHRLIGLATIWRKSTQPEIPPSTWIPFKLLKRGIRLHDLDHKGLSLEYLERIASWRGQSLYE